MLKFRNGNYFVLFFSTIYAPLVFGDQVPPQQQIPPTQQQSRQQQQPCDRTRRVFTEAHGEISDGPAGSNYTQVRPICLCMRPTMHRLSLFVSFQDSHCEWLIKAKNDSQFITLTFRSMGTECSYDYIFVYDGDSFKSPLLGSFSGKTEPQQVIATSGSVSAFNVLRNISV